MGDFEIMALLIVIVMAIMWLIHLKGKRRTEKLEELNKAKQKEG